MLTYSQAITKLASLDETQYETFIHTSKIHKQDKRKLLDYLHKGVLADICYNYIKAINW